MIEKGCHMGNKLQLQAISQRQLDNNGIDAHKFKKDYLPSGTSVSLFDIKYDKNTHLLYLVQKSDSSIIIDTGTYFTP